MKLGFTIFCLHGMALFCTCLEIPGAKGSKNVQRQSKENQARPLTARPNLFPILQTIRAERVQQNENGVVTPPETRKHARVWHATEGA